MNKNDINVRRITKCIINVTQNEVKTQVYLPNVLLTTRLALVADTHPKARTHVAGTPNIALHRLKETQQTKKKTHTHLASRCF